jgi:hypothetical protein
VCLKWSAVVEGGVSWDFGQRSLTTAILSGLATLCVAPQDTLIVEARS